MDYRYRDDLFPSTHFRMFYDLLCDTFPTKSTKIYLEILYRAAYNSEEKVEREIVKVLNKSTPLRLTDCTFNLSNDSDEDVDFTPLISAPDLTEYDTLLPDGFHE